MQSTMSTIVRPGKVTSHQSSVPPSCPSAISFPSAVVEGWIPKPRNVSSPHGRASLCDQVVELDRREHDFAVTFDEELGSEASYRLD